MEGRLEQRIVAVANRDLLPLRLAALIVNIGQQLAFGKGFGFDGAHARADRHFFEMIAVAEGNENNDGIKALVDVLKSDDVKKFIADTYDGAVVAFE